MKILFVAAEMNPLAKVGGLADVIGSLPKALRRLGLDVRVLIPHYRLVDETSEAPIMRIVDSFPVRMNSRWVKDTTLSETYVGDVPVYLVGTNQWFDRSVSSETLYQQGGDQHLFLCEAALESLKQLDWIPDVIHCHDWHTGFLPVLMREKHQAEWDRTASVFTIHNFAYQGEFGLDVLDRLELPRRLFNPDQLETWGRVNFLKAGCVFADQVNTVSRVYAEEIQTPEFGCSLEGLMRHLASEGRLSGILNGLDYTLFDPATDPNIPAHFSLTDTRGKEVCKRRLQAELGLSQAKMPLCGVVSRMSAQKGLDILLAAGVALVDTPVQLVVQGLGDPALIAGFRKLQAEFPKRVRMVEEFNAGLAQRIYAGSDMFLMPSRFEPCGLGQMIAMRYGTLPIVRMTGGLKETVQDGRTGFGFEHGNTLELLDAMARASQAYKNKAAWRELMIEAMRADFSWDRSAAEYARLYQACAADRLVSTA